MRLELPFFTRKATTYACEVLGVTRSKITSCKPTGRGFSNRSFCVIVSYQKAYQVRLARSDFPIDRRMEKTIMEAVGFSFVDFNEENGNYVRSWINGTTPCCWDEHLLRNLVSVLKKLHGTAAPEGVSVFNPFFYDGKASLPKKYASSYEQLVNKYQDQPLVLCHNDVHGANLVLQCGQLVLIDYEWSCLNSPLWELGNFIREENLSPLQIGVLANEYGQGVSLADLYDHVFLASCYGWLWARSMPFSLKISKQRRKTTKNLKAAHKALSTIF